MSHKVVIISASFLCFFLSYFLFGAVSYAISCIPSDQPHGLTDTERSYQINTESFEQNTNFDEDDILGAVVQSADTWNEQAASGTFVYAGQTEHVRLPRDKVDCDQQGISHSLVVFRNEQGAKGQAIARCLDSNG